MQCPDSIIATFPGHLAAEAAVKKLAAGGFSINDLTIVGKGYHTDEKVVGFYNIDERIKFWGSRGAFWGGLWGLFFGGIFLAAPIIGPVMVLGYLGSILVTALEGAVAFGGLGVLGAALSSIGVPADSVLQYQTAIAADEFLVMAHGSAEQIVRAKAILGSASPTQVTVYEAAVPSDVTCGVETLA